MPLFDMFKKKKPEKKRAVKPRKIKPKKDAAKGKIKRINQKIRRKILREPKKKIRKIKPIGKPLAKEKIAVKPKIPEIQKLKDEKVYELLKSSGIPIANYFFCKKEKDLPFAKRIGFPCIMKVCSEKDIEPKKILLNSEEQALQSFNELMKIKNAESVFMQKQIAGLEILVGMKSDSQFGYILSASLGGIYKEVLRDIVFRICPIAIADVESMIRELKGYEILEKNAATDKLYNILFKFGKLAIKEKLEQMSITLICNKDNCWVTDAKIMK